MQVGKKKGKVENDTRKASESGYNRCLESGFNEKLYNF